MDTTEARVRARVRVRVRVRVRSYGDIAKGMVWVRAPGTRRRLG